jgi:hypothetical protein
MGLILDAFWMATCWAARMFTVPLKRFVYLLSLLLWWTGARQRKRARRTGRGRPDTAFSHDATDWAQPVCVVAHHRWPLLLGASRAYEYALGPKQARFSADFVREVKRT